jgi:hypothetical protein
MVLPATLAAITGWGCTSFTTVEAQRVLTRVGFVVGVRVWMTKAVAVR